MSYKVAYSLVGYAENILYAVIPENNLFLGSLGFRLAVFAGEYGIDFFGFFGRKRISIAILIPIIE
ncbi:MAG: hypothetical protein NTY64_22910, partial [Deltaproteobacteria bacterium]|nr:hypothetical protein [Deltaproteobacteria bacterium]